MHLQESVRVCVCFVLCFNYFSVSLVFFAFIFIKCYHFLLVFRALFNDNFAPIQLIRLNLDLCVSAVWFIPILCVFFRFFFRERVNCFSARGWLGMVPLISRLPELMVFGSEMFCFLCEFSFVLRDFSQTTFAVKLYCLFCRWKGGWWFLEHSRSLLGKIDTWQLKERSHDICDANFTSYHIPITMFKMILMSFRDLLKACRKYLFFFVFFICIKMSRARLSNAIARCKCECFTFWTRKRAASSYLKCKSLVGSLQVLFACKKDDSK